MAHDIQSNTPGQAGKGSISQPTGYLFNKISLLILLGFLLLAVWGRQAVIVILIGLVLSAAGVSWLWSRLSLVGVQCQRTLSEPRVFPGESTELRLRLVNRKLLPLPWVQVDDEIPEALAPDNATMAASERPGFRTLSNTASVLWYSTMTWRCRLLCRKRGYYSLGPLTVSSGDIFGFYPRASEQASADHVIVYPRTFPIARLDIPSLYPMGETPADRRIFEDPTRTIGVRDYAPTDSLRRIHWKASARRQNLQVKVFEPTTTLNVAVFLAVDSFQRDVPTRDDDFELGISAAASIASHLVQQRSPTGLFVNTRLADTGQPARIFPGTSLGHLVNMLEALAKTVLIYSTPLEEFMQEEWRSLPWGTTIVLVLSHPPKGLPGVLARIKAGGYKVMVIQVGEEDRPGIEHTAAWHTVRTAEDLNDLRVGADL